jgi:hypothetical protein
VVLSEHFPRGPKQILTGTNVIPRMETSNVTTQRVLSQIKTTCTVRFSRTVDSANESSRQDAHRRFYVGRKCKENTEYS